MQNQHTVLLGAHLSVAGGLEHALFDGHKIGCTAVQIFTHSNRQWRISPLTDEEIERFMQAKTTTGIAHVVVHASYLINLASANAAIRELSLKTLIQELKRCEQLGIQKLILHPGSHVESTEEAGISSLVQGLDAALAAVEGTTSIAIENMAGQGTSLGRTLEQLATIRAQAHHKERIGICIDTCHLCAAGYDFSSAETYAAFWKTFDTLIGLEHLEAIHVNDSKKPCGSRVDRHTHVGEGTLGLEPFRLLMNDRRFDAIPKIIETPKDSLEEDTKNLTVLRGLIKS